MSKCPICGIRVSYLHNLKVHLAGREPKGHGKSELEADEIARRVFDGTFITPHKRVLPAPALHSAELLANPYAAFLIQLFDTLVSNKRLPKYQFERRVDAIITLFLPGIMQQLYGWKIDLVAPEFPLRKEENNLSTNVDHLLFRHGDERNQPAWIFFELKTDAASCRDLQLDIYGQAMRVGMPDLLKKLKKIIAATKETTKYSVLSERIALFPLEAPIELVYLAPCRIMVPFAGVHALSFADLQEITVSNFSHVWELFQKMVIPSLLA